MTSYLLLIHGDESAYDTMTEDALNHLMGKHEEFTEALTRRGHSIVAAAELTSAKEATVFRGPQSITEGPYAETAEQIGGFYFVETDNRQDFLECARILAEVHPDLEIRAGAEHG